MPKLSRFDPPANHSDLHSRPLLEEAFRARWSANVHRYIEVTQQNDPWSSVNQPPLTDYYNPLETDTPPGGASIAWTAFPNRIKLLYPNVGARAQWKYADDGPPASYPGPMGPRGWQDEYCEWSVTRNASGRITRVSFTCENPEYWYTLWQYFPNRVLELYRELVSPDVKLEDLYLRDPTSRQPLIDPETGRPAYDDRNMWNGSTTRGAVHLICNASSLFDEIFLAGQATVLRADPQGNPITDRNRLIACSRYGTPGRNSDPTIGTFVNDVVRAGNSVSLSNPVGLYLQAPSFSQYQLPFTAPPGRKPSDYWRVVRGHARGPGDPIDYILHATYEVPPADSFTVGDITINGVPIDFGAQIVETMQVALCATPIPRRGPEPQAHPCAGDASDPLPRAYVMAYSDVLEAAFRSSLNLRLEQGAVANDVVVYLLGGNSDTKLLSKGGTGVSFKQLDYESLGEGEGLVTLEVRVDIHAPLGNRSVSAINSDGTHGPPVFGLFEIVPAGSLRPRLRPRAAGTMNRSALRGLRRCR